MKRNSIFMLSYILFFVICLVVRFFYDYPMWNKIVVAITVSSVCFAYAELFRTLADSIEELNSSRLRRCKEINETVSIIIDHINVLKRKREDENEYKTHLENAYKIKKSAEVAENYYSKIKVHKICRIGCNINLLLAYLQLFCTLAFDNLAQRLVGLQSYATVIAFILIMLTPLVGDFIKKKNRKTKQKDELIDNGLSALEESLRKEILYDAD